MQLIIGPGLELLWIIKQIHINDISKVHHSPEILPNKKRKSHEKVPTSPLPWAWARSFRSNLARRSSSVFTCCCPSFGAIALEISGLAIFHLQLLGQKASWVGFSGDYFFGRVHLIFFWWLQAESQQTFHRCHGPLIGSIPLRPACKSCDGATLVVVKVRDVAAGCGSFWLIDCRTT